MEFKKLTLKLAGHCPLHMAFKKPTLKLAGHCPLHIEFKKLTLKLAVHCPLHTVFIQLTILSLHGLYCTTHTGPHNHNFSNIIITIVLHTFLTEIVTSP